MDFFCPCFHKVIDYNYLSIFVRNIKLGYSVNNMKKPTNSYANYCELVGSLYP